MNVLLVLVFLALAGAGRKPVDPLKVEEPAEVPPVDTTPQPTEIKMYHPATGTPLVLDSTNPVDIKEGRFGGTATDPNKYYVGFSNEKHWWIKPTGALWVWRGTSNKYALPANIEPYNAERYY